MSIRNAAKALILHEGKLLLNKCLAPDGGVYYTLPGGGQNQYETMEEAVRRECLEETGYSVIPDRLAALYEEILTNESLRKTDSDYTHRIFHLFLCHVKNTDQAEPIEKDSDQLGTEWIPVKELRGIRFYPKVIQDSLEDIIRRREPLYLGSRRVKTSLCLPRK